MELKIVYRVLRKISDWTVAGYYSETYVEGQENIPKHGPLIIASTHHNEMIDIATLAATMPHRRRLAFWAKSTMFVNPISGAILSSSGAIPVRRNPNNNGSATPPSKPSVSASASPSASGSTSGSGSGSGSGGTGSAAENATAELAQRSVLFRDTSRALAADGVVGVFPEGTSYTQASIVQVMPGAAWAAVEFARYLQRGEGVGVGGGKEERVNLDKGNGKGKEREREREVKTGLRIVPVAVVYTDKAKYQSRISVRYGEPIFMDEYTNELLEGDPDEASKAVVKKIMGQVEKQLREMTINAPDWDTLCAVSMARNILWEDERHLPLDAWVEVSQRSSYLFWLFRLVQLFDLPSDSPLPDVESVQHLKTALTRYYALLHYSGIKHAILSSLLPLSSSSLLDIPPPHSLPGTGILIRPTISILAGLPVSLIQLALFIPPLLLHFPGYIAGSLSKRLATKGEEESPAQFKAIGAGVGIGTNIALALGVLWKKNKLGALSALLGLGDWAQEDGSAAHVKRILGVIGTVYCSVLVLVKWHKLLVNGEHGLTCCAYRSSADFNQWLQRLMTFHKLVSAFAFSRNEDSLSTTALEPYTKPPLPAANIFIKKITKEGSSSSSSSSSDGDDEDSTRKPPAPIASRKLVRHLLHARAGACAALSSHLIALEDKTLLRYLISKGAKLRGS
ncbi:hypothetical protein CVT25_012497 [Psilocybe cyanescens]|uniref:Phospholipid/glycerol acyltransferase domain-containing protein n=1 Tax=Psilocybe cyanescens TaxID=93625 RepID=A0A409X0T1_PSICY|nr:hypothetical protein CVT25_012497 [Psilocybe cyanescens]